jgi:hypothetical protein
MTIQMTRLPHDSAETATGRDALPLPQEETPLRTAHAPQRDAVTVQLGQLAARIGRLEGVQAGQEAVQRDDAEWVQVMIRHHAVQGTELTGITTVHVHGPEMTAAGKRRDRVRWPRYRAG